MVGEMVGETRKMNKCQMMLHLMDHDKDFGYYSIQW